MMDLKNITILYVEDEHTIRKANATLFKSEFKNVYTAINGAEGIERFEQYKDEIDLIVSDISMPIMNGLDMIEKIKIIYGTKNIKFMLTTAYTDKDYLIKAINLGVFGYIEKPINVSILFEKVNEIFSKDNTLEIVDLYDNFQYFFNEKIVKKEHRVIRLTSDEALLLELLINFKDEILDYKTLQSANGSKPISMDALRSTIKRIRQKTNNDLIITLSGVGYKINL